MRLIRRRLLIKNIEEETPSNPTLTVDVASESQGNGTVYIGTKGTTSKSVAASSSVTVYAEPDSSSIFTKWTSGTSTTSLSTNTAYTFNMPSSDLTLHGTFGEKPTTSTGTIRIKTNLNLDNFVESATLTTSSSTSVGSYSDGGKTYVITNTVGTSATVKFKLIVNGNCFTNVKGDESELILSSMRGYNFLIQEGTHDYTVYYEDTNVAEVEIQMVEVFQGPNASDHQIGWQLGTCSNESLNTFMADNSKDGDLLSQGSLLEGSSNSYGNIFKVKIADVLYTNAVYCLFKSEDQHLAAPPATGTIRNWSGTLTVENPSGGLPNNSYISAQGGYNVSIAISFFEDDDYIPRTIVVRCNFTYNA